MNPRFFVVFKSCLCCHHCLSSVSTYGVVSLPVSIAITISTGAIWLTRTLNALPTDIHYCYCGLLLGSSFDLLIVRGLLGYFEIWRN